MGQVLLCFLFQRCLDQGSEKLKDLLKITQLVSNRAGMEPRVLLCKCQGRPFGPLLIPTAGPLPPQYPVPATLEESAVSGNYGMEIGQWELGEMTWPRLESHPTLKQSGPHGMDSPCIHPVLLQVFMDALPKYYSEV